MDKKTFLFRFLLFLGLFLSAEEPYHVLVLGDLHYDGPRYHVGELHRPEYAGMWQDLRTPSLLKAAASRLDGSFPFVIQLGDLANGYADTEEQQKQMLQDAFLATKKFFPDHRFLVVKGNHDVSLTSGKNNAPAAEALLPSVACEAGIPSLRCFTYAQVFRNDLYLFLDGFDDTVNRVDFVRETLAKYPEARYVFLVTHLPILPAATGKPQWLLPDYEKIAALAAPRNAIILAGHTHAFSLIRCEDGRGGRLTELITSSIGLHWDKTAQLRPRIRHFQEYRQAMKKRKKPYPFEMHFSAEKFSEFLIYPKNCTGFTVLEISAEGVTATWFNGSGGETLSIPLLPRRTGGVSPEARRRK